jgi:ribosome-binding factor A
MARAAGLRRGLDLMSPGNAPSQRQLRAGELIRHALADLFMRGETGDPQLEHIGVSVLEVQITPDLRIATAYVRPFLAGREDDLLSALDRGRKHIRHLLAPKLDMKFMPDIRFRIDTAMDYADKIDSILNRPEVARDLKKE